MGTAERSIRCNAPFLDDFRHLCIYLMAQSSCIAFSRISFTYTESYLPNCKSLLLGACQFSQRTLAVVSFSTPFTPNSVFVFHSFLSKCSVHMIIILQPQAHITTGSGKFGVPSNSCLELVICRFHSRPPKSEPHPSKFLELNDLCDKISTTGPLTYLIQLNGIVKN